MPKGTKLIKRSAIITNYCCTFAAVVFFYLLFHYIQLPEKVKAGFTEDARTKFVVLMTICIIIHIYRAFAAGFAQRRAYLPDSLGRILGMCTAALILSVIWLVIVIIQMTSQGWLLSLSYLETIFLVMAIVDVVGFSLIIYGAAQSRAQGSSQMGMAAAPKGVQPELPPIKLPKKK